LVLKTGNQKLATADTKESHLPDKPPTPDEKLQLEFNRWALAEYGKAVRDVTAGIEAYRFNDAANAAYRFVWNVFCDWYLELAKPVFMGEDVALKAETRASVAYVIDGIAKLLHPFMPYITEELWAIKGETGPARPETEKVLALASWPVLPDMAARVSFLTNALDKEAMKAPPKTIVPSTAVVDVNGRGLSRRSDWT